MDAVKYLKEKTRMLNSIGRKGGKCLGASCRECPLGQANNGKDMYCSDLPAYYPEETVEIVEKWSKEHPQKTILQDFLEKYPNAQMDQNGVPIICIRRIFPSIVDCEENYPNCKNCWNRPLEG